MSEPTATPSARLHQRAEQLAAPLPPLLVAAERVAMTVAQGVHGRRRVGAGEAFWQFRRYYSGDPASTIDWRRSAKTERLYVRQTEWEAVQSVWMWRDASPSMHYGSAAGDVAKIDRATLLALALAVLLTRAGEHVALLGRDHQPRTGPVALSRMAAALAGDELGPSLPHFENLPRDARAVLIGDFLSPIDEIERCLTYFAGIGVAGHLLEIRDPAEEQLPFAGRARFEGLEAEGRITVGRVEKLRQTYLDRIGAHRAAVVTAASRLGWTVATHRTDRPPETALLALYAGLSKGSRR